jgi:hypothetical protein
MITHLDESFSNHKAETVRPGVLSQTVWLRLIALWLTVVVAAFFFIRIIGSETVRHILSRILVSHLR